MTAQAAGDVAHLVCCVLRVVVLGVLVHPNYDLHVWKRQRSRLLRDEAAQDTLRVACPL